MQGDTMKKTTIAQLSQLQECKFIRMSTTLNKRQLTFLLLLFGFSLITGVNLLPNCSDGTWEVLAEEETHFNCTAEGEMQWKLRFNDSPRPISLAICNTNCIMLNTYQGLFAASITDLHTSTLTINPKNNRKLYDNVHLVNGSVVCNRGDMEDKLAVCGLNFVYPPENVSCTVSNTSWVINVSCIIENFYSSRKLYKCSLIRKQTSKTETLETVTMVTFPTITKITKNEVKVSGSCLFTTTLPTDEGSYGFLVSVSPGKRSFMPHDKQFTVEQPRSPTVSCDPQPYVLENTSVNCTCRTNSLGQPAGYLRWFTGNQKDPLTAVTKEKQEITSKVLHHSQVLTLSDHDNIWFRCDVIWGTNQIRGENYTASVGYAPKTPSLFFNGLKRNETVNERDQINFVCESDGRPTPNIAIYNNDSGTVIVRASSPVNYTFIARCEDTATYTCSAWNEFSRQSDVVTLLKMDVNCKPRSLLSTHLGTVKFRNKPQELSFEVVAFPEPHNYDARFVTHVVNHSKPFFRKVEGSELNVTCKGFEKRRYLSRCTLTIIGIPSHSDGFYHVQVINEHGEENFTVEIGGVGLQDMESYNAAFIYGIVCLVIIIFATVVLIAVIKKTCRRKGEQPTQAWDSVQPLEANLSAGPSGHDLCQTPVYAVVDKTRKKTTTQTVHFADAAQDNKEAKRDDPQVVTASSSGLQSDTDPDYAVLGVFRRDKDYNYKKKEPSTNTMKGFVADDDGLKIYDHLAKQQLPPQQDITARWDLPCPASHPHDGNNGRRATDDDLISVTPFFDVSDNAKRHQPLWPKETKYYTSCGMEKNFPQK